jgi:enoyl-CoA hydratase/carnithine racemase
MNVLAVDVPVPYVWRVLINRPEKRNAINHEVRQALLDLLEQARGDERCRALVFGGVGGVFSAGGDLPSMVGITEQQARERMEHIHCLCHSLATLPLPVITAVEGFGAGAGVGLALLGDHIVVGPESRILFPFMKLGLAPDWGMLRSLPARVGVAVSRQVLLGGEAISGGRAAAIGLADELAEDGDVMKLAINRAEKYAALPQAAFAKMKIRLNTPAPSLQQELTRELDDQAELLLAPDFAEGYSAFMEKRTADFINRE